jgi:hypothetical protein
LDPLIYFFLGAAFFTAGFFAGAFFAAGFFAATIFTHLPPERVIILIILSLNKYFGRNGYLAHRIAINSRFVLQKTRGSRIGGCFEPIRSEMRNPDIQAPIAQKQDICTAFPEDSIDRANAANERETSQVNGSIAPAHTITPTLPGHPASCS